MPNIKVKFSNEEYRRAKKWLQEHNLWKGLEHEDGFSVVYYYWNKRYGNNYICLT